MEHKQQRATRGLITINGMKTPAEWDRMTSAEKMDWLASLSPLERLGQAGVNAVASRRSPEAVMLAWVTVGFLSHTEALEALAAEPDATRGGVSQL